MKVTRRSKEWHKTLVSLLTFDPDFIFEYEVLGAHIIQNKYDMKALRLRLDCWNVQHTLATCRALNKP